MGTQPSQPVVDQILYTLRRSERSQQLFSFVYSTLMDIAEQKHDNPQQM